MRRRLLALVLLLLTAAPSAVVAAAADDPGRVDQWALDRIGAPVGGGQGDGVVVAVVDSGVDLAHADLRANLVPGIDTVDGDAVPQDEFGHGTHVAGIVGAVAGNGTGIAGVAPQASIMPIRVLDETGAGELDDVVAGIRWAVAHGADVVNLSMSEDTQALFGPELSDVLGEVWDAGVVPVVAAGNQYVLGSGFGDEPALVVAATTRADGKPSYSSGVGAASWGIAAPGGEDPMLGEAGAILSTYWVEGETDQYAFDCGTSMAAPHVAGAVAVLLGLGLSPAEAVDRLLSTATDIGVPGRDETFGVGLLNLAAASDGIDPANGPSPDGGEQSPPTTATPSNGAPSSQAPDGGATTSTPAPPPTTSGSPSTAVSDASTSSEDAAGTAAEMAADGGDDHSGSNAVPAIVAAVLAAGALAGGVVLRRR